MQLTRFWPLAVLGTIAIAGGAPRVAAQVPFQILRPQNNATVRETVRIQVPRNAVPPDGYLAYTIDDRFRVALAVPPVPPRGTDRNEAMEWNADTISYLWDTKAIENDPKLSQEERVIKEGNHTIEVAAFDRSGKQVGSQKVTVTVGNQLGLTSAAEGVPLSYKFRVGDTIVHTQHTEVDFIGGRQASASSNRGGRSSSRGARGGGLQMGGEGQPDGLASASQLSGPYTPTIQTVDARHIRTVEDSLGGGSYFLRDKVLRGTILTGNGGAARLEDAYALKSRYRTVATTGRVVSYGTLSASKPGAYIALPIIDLGGGRRRVKQTWETRVPLLLEWATLDAPPLVRATNTLEGLEWQDGYQTARIRQTFRGTADVPIHGGMGTMQKAQVDMERIIWFGYNPGRIIRMETTVNVDGEGPSNVVQAMLGSAGASGGPEGGSPAPSLPGLTGDPEDVPDRFPGLIGGGSPFGANSGSFGAVAQQPEAVKVPVKFRSNTTVLLVAGARE